LEHHFDVLPENPMGLAGLSREELQQSLERDFTRCFASVHPIGDAPFAKALIDAQLDFVKDASGAVTHVILHQNGRDVTAKWILSETPAPAQRKQITVKAKLFDRYVGRYELAPGFLLTVTRAGDRFFAQATSQPKIEIFAETERDYFLKGVDAQITFATDSHGRVTGLTLHDNGRALSVKRIK